MKSIKPVDIAMLLLRFVVGVILVYAGSQKVFGVLGGAGVQGTIESFGQMGIPKAFAYLAMAGELLGGLGLIFGVLTRLAAFGAACTMAVAVYKMAALPGIWQKVVNGEDGGMNRIGFPLVLFAGAAAVLLLGAGRISLDRLIFRKRKSGS